MLNEKIHQLKSFLESTEIDYNQFNNLLEDLYEVKDTVMFKEAMKAIRAEYDIISTNATMQGRAFKKEYGYAGDFEIIDKIYTQHVSPKFPDSEWDKFFHSQPAPIAVRNRKRYFIEKMKSLNNNGKMSILNLASGPCRDIFELYQSSGNGEFYFDCVELDENAILFAKNILKGHLSKVVFINKNIFRYTPKKRYDVIWSAGLFDYFDDKAFVMILKRLLESHCHGKIIIGNFSDQNPTMPYMELIGEWYLNYRSPDKLVELALMAGAVKESISIETEPEGVNLFLNIN